MDQTGGKSDFNEWKLQSYEKLFAGYYSDGPINVNKLRPGQNGRHFPDDLSNGFSWMKMYEFRCKFHWSLFLGVQLAIFQHWFRWWLGADQATSHYLNWWWLVSSHIYASFGLNESNHRVIAWCFIGYKSLSKSMGTLFTGTKMLQLGLMSQCISTLIFVPLQVKYPSQRQWVSLSWWPSLRFTTVSCNQVSEIWGCLIFK